VLERHSDVVQAQSSMNSVGFKTGPDGLRLAMQLALAGSSPALRSLQRFRVLEHRMCLDSH
jgi:hypothetical protein